jgi:predicted MPP superfamily phosphohydrolase
MPVPQLVLLLTGLFGHFALWIAVINRLHAAGMARWRMELLEKLAFLLMVGILGWLLGWLTLSAPSAGNPVAALQRMFLPEAYFWLCFGVAIPVLGNWAWRSVRRAPQQLLQSHSEVLHIDRHLGHLPCGDAATRFLAHLPGNQILQLEISTKTVRLPKLQPALDGLIVAHLSDLHFTGQLTSDFFHTVVDQTNRMQPDLVAVTGDIIDNPDCLGWIPEVLGRIESRYGCFCVLGNHDRRIEDRDLFRRTLHESNLEYVGGRCHTIQVRGCTLAIGGNEMPWFAPAADMMTCCSDVFDPCTMRLLLSHTPDQIPWARRHRFDLMLAGHNHGGQIRVPVIGPIISPSRYGVTYASGLFYRPPTLLHVSRGVSGVQNLRINCRPEITKLVLHT